MNKEIIQSRVFAVNNHTLTFTDLLIVVGTINAAANHPADRLTSHSEIIDIQKLSISFIQNVERAWAAALDFKQLMLHKLFKLKLHSSFG